MNTTDLNVKIFRIMLERDDYRVIYIVANSIFEAYEKFEKSGLTERFKLGRLHSIDDFYHRNDISMISEGNEELHVYDCRLGLGENDTATFKMIIANNFKQCIDHLKKLDLGDLYLYDIHEDLSTIVYQ
jgi:hypothetical protein